MDSKDLELRLDVAVTRYIDLFDAFTLNHLIYEKPHCYRVSTFLRSFLIGKGEPIKQEVVSIWENTSRIPLSKHPLIIEGFKQLSHLL